MIYKAVQQIMLGTVCKTELQTKETLTTIKAAGYDGIELNGFMIRPTPFLVRMLTKFSGMPVGKGGNYNWKELIRQSQLNVVSIHEDLGTIQRDRILSSKKPKTSDRYYRYYRNVFVLLF